MPERKSVTNKVVGAGKKVLATDAAQGVIGAVADKMEEIAVDKADECCRNRQREGRQSWRPQAQLQEATHHSEDRC
jgi:hypothetical protein